MAEKSETCATRAKGELKEHIRGADIACRYGGEELTLVLPGASLETITNRGLAHSDAGKLSYEAAVNAPPPGRRFWG
jgi:GGDEF domain-containing protein